jgi:hypothetical protein
MFHSRYEHGNAAIRGYYPHQACNHLSYFNSPNRFTFVLVHFLSDDVSRFVNGKSTAYSIRYGTIGRPRARCFGPRRSRGSIKTLISFRHTCPADDPWPRGGAGAAGPAPPHGIRAWRRYPALSRLPARAGMPGPAECVATLGREPGKPLILTPPAQQRWKLGVPPSAGAIEARHAHAAAPPIQKISPGYARPRCARPPAAPAPGG